MRQDDQLIGMLAQAGVTYNDEYLPVGKERMIEVKSGENDDILLFMFDRDTGLLIEVI